jgi:hypothetical protein
MIPELGHYALVPALALGLLQSVVPLIGARRRNAALMRLACRTARMQCAFVAIAFLALVLCYGIRLFSAHGLREFPFADAAHLQDRQRVGEARLGAVVMMLGAVAHRPAAAHRRAQAGCEILAAAGGVGLMAEAAAADEARQRFSS